MWFWGSSISSQGKTVLVTGTDQGIGYETVLQLVEKGFKVFACCYTKEGIERWNQLKNPKIRPLQLDVTNEGSIQKCVKIVEEEAPEGLFCLVNNAGVFNGFIVEWSTMQQIRDNMEVNYFGMVAMIKAFLNLIRKGKGRIINISSIAGIFSTIGFGSYSASKFAIEGITNALRAELSLFNIPIVLIEPGFTKTSFVADLIGKFEKDWSNLPSETKSIYGHKFYSNVHSAISFLSNLTSTQPSKVASKIVEATISKNPKQRYLCGAESYVLAIIANYFPTSIVDFFLSKALPILGIKPQRLQN